MPTPEQLIEAGPVSNPAEVLPKPIVDSPPPRPSTSDTKVTSATPARVQEDDPVKRLQEFVEEKPAKEEEKKTDTGDTKATEKAEEKQEEDDAPPTTRPIRPKPPLEEQLKNEDFAGLEDEEVNFLKKMSKESREWTKARIKEAKELKKRLAESPNTIPNGWYEHEEAYTLHPQFKTAMSNAQQASWETNYWKEQLVAIRNGEKWNDLEYRNVNGKPTLVRIPQEPSADAEIELQTRINRGIQLERESIGLAESIKGSFVLERSRIQQAIQAIEDKFFPDLRDPKAMEGNKYVANFDQLLSKFNQQSNPIAGFARKLYKWALDVYDRNQELEKEVAGKTSIKEERKLAGPTAGELQGSKAKEVDPDDKPFRFEDFAKYKGG